MSGPIRPVFQKKWWDKVKPFTLRNTGMGAALANWEKNCLHPPKLKERQHFDAAYETAYQLNSTCAATKKKCGKSHKEIVACMDKFPNEIATYIKSLEAEQKKRCVKYKQDREALRDFAQDGLAAMNAYMSQCNQLAKEVDQLADKAETIINKGGNSCTF